MDRGDCQADVMLCTRSFSGMNESLSRRTGLTGSVPGHTNKSISGQAGKQRSEQGEFQNRTDTHYATSY